MTYFYMMVGIPGCGKSTWVKENIHSKKIKIHSTDAIIEEIAAKSGLTYNEAFEDNIGEATKIFFNNIKTSVDNQEDFVVDRTNLTVKSRKRILDMVAFNYIKVAVVVTCSDPIIHSYRLQNRPEKNIPAHIIENMKNTYQEPTTAEGFNSITFVETSPILGE